MISPIYSDLQAMATCLLTEFDGRATPMQLQRKTGSSVSSVTGLFVAGALQTFNVTGIISPQEKSKKEPTTEQMKTLQAILTFHVLPLEADGLLVDGLVYQITKVQPIKPSDIVLLYKVQAER